MRITPMNIAGVFDFAERINHHMDERKKLNLNLVYNQIKDKYPVVLTNTYALDNGKKEFDEDYQIMYGMSTVGKFLLYDDGLDIVFDVDKADGTYTHWHPIDTEEAIKDVILFMGGTSKY